MGALSVPPLEWYPLGTVRPVRVMAKQQQKRQALRLPPTARSRWQSRGLHPVGALSMPPLEWYPLGTVRPVRVTAKQQKKTRSRREEIGRAHV